MKNTKKISLVTIISLSLFCSPVAEAETTSLEASEPFIVTQSINTELIDADSCISLIRSHSTAADTSSLESQTILADIESLQAEMNYANQTYQRLNQEIALLEAGEEDSLNYAQSQLAVVIELIYEDYLATDPAFVLLNNEEQMNIISQHDVIIEWQDYILQLQQLINQKVIERDNQENYYYQLVYQIENQTRLLEEEKSNQAQLNQCLLYPYSTTYLDSSNILLNSNNDSLESYLMEVDLILQKIVPSNYRKVSFHDIYRLFELPKDEESSIEFLSNKENIYVDEYGLAQYAYAKELSLYDLEVLGNYAKRDYLKLEDLVSFQESYQSALALKEAQFAYFFQINQESFLTLSDQLANYLNSQNLISQEVIKQIQTLHNRHQIKFVYFNDVTQTWSANKTGFSGYYEIYNNLSLLDNIPIDTITGNPAETDNFDEDKDHSSESQNGNGDLLDETPEQPVDNTDALDYLKDQLTNNSGSPSKVKNSDLPSPNELKNSSESSSNSGNTSLSLPNTGEVRFWTILGIVLLMIGLLMLLANQITRRKRREKLDEIELD